VNGEHTDQWIDTLLKRTFAHCFNWSRLAACRTGRCSSSTCRWTRQKHQRLIPSTDFSRVSTHTYELANIYATNLQHLSPPCHYTLKEPKWLWQSFWHSSSVWFNGQNALWETLCKRQTCGNGRHYF